MLESTKINEQSDLTDLNLPSWLPRISLENAVRSQIGVFEKVLSIVPQSSTAGNSHSTLMVRLLVEVELIG